MILPSDSFSRSSHSSSLPSFILSGAEKGRNGEVGQNNKSETLHEANKKGTHKKYISMGFSPLRFFFFHFQCVYKYHCPCFCFPLCTFDYIPSCAQRVLLFLLPLLRLLLLMKTRWTGCRRFRPADGCGPPRGGWRSAGASQTFAPSCPGLACTT